jgi:DMSO reductase anchor subunit
MARGWCLLDTAWMLVGVIGAVLSAVTVFTTSMIYTQMKTVPRWNTPLTPLLFMAIALAGGALLAGQVEIALILMPVAAAVQVIWWLRGDKALAQSGTDMATATGLGNIGSVRAFEPPHTGNNYLLREFVYVVGRKHAQKLRMIALLFGYTVPFVLLLVPFSHIAALVAVLAHLGGIAASRWLFFAEAEHVVGLYYGKR